MFHIEWRFSGSEPLREDFYDRELVASLLSASMVLFLAISPFSRKTTYLRADRDVSDLRRSPSCAIRCIAVTLVLPVLGSVVIRVNSSCLQPWQLL